jgi:transcriptional regulator with XRE-family HTH domain
MNVGDRIKQLRTERNLTQPQLAEVIGIEQSYLSKLENDKSVPSADIFQAILKGFAVDVATFLEGIDERIVRGELRQIPEVAHHINAGVTVRIHNIRKWLFGSAAAVILGLTLGVAGYKGLVFSDKQFTYSSPGVILPGEPSNIFSNYSGLLHARKWSGEITEEERNKLEVEFNMKRVRQDLLLSDYYRGEEFGVPVDGGERRYELKKISDYVRVENRYLMLLGSLLTFAGLFGFFVESRLRSVKIARV